MRIQTCPWGSLLLPLTALILFFAPFQSASGQEKLPKSRKEYLTLCWFWNIAGRANKELESKTFLGIRDSVGFPQADLVRSIKEALNTSSEATHLQVGPNSWDMGGFLRYGGDRMKAKIEGIVRNLDKVTRTAELLGSKWQGLYETALKYLASTQYGDTPPQKAKETEFNTFYARSGGGAKRQEACLAKTGAPGTKAYAGISLANDLLCICLKGGSSNSYDGATNLCGVKNPYATEWGDDGITGPSAELKKYTDDCAGASFPDNISEENLQYALATFEHHLGANIVGGASVVDIKIFRSVFGHASVHTSAAGANLCKASGSSANSNNVGQCVNYGDASNGDIKPIDWRTTVENSVKKLSEAKVVLDQYRKQAHKAEILVQAFETILNDANASIAHPEGDRSIQAASQKSKGSGDIKVDKTTIQDPATVSVAVTSRFILPWTLL